MKQKDVGKPLQELIKKGLLKKTGKDEYKSTKKGTEITKLLQKADERVKDYLENLLTDVKSGAQTAYDCEDEVKKLYSSMTYFHEKNKPHILRNILEDIISNDIEVSRNALDSMFKRVIAKLLYEYVTANKINTIPDLQVMYKKICFISEAPGYA